MGLGLKLKPTGTSYVNVMIRNGVGYKMAENDIYKNLQVRAGTFLKEIPVHLSVYAEVEPWKGVDNSGAPKSYMNLQWDVMATYAQKGRFLVGVDINSKTFAGDFEDITALCYSGFGNVYISGDRLKALARYDKYDTGFNDARLAVGEAFPETNAGLIIIGLDYMPHKNVHIIPNVQILTFERSNVKSDNSAFLHLEFIL